MPRSLGKSARGSRDEASIFDTDVSAMDWVHYGAWTVKGHTAFLHVLRWAPEITLTGLDCRTVTARFLADGTPITFTQTGDKLTLTGLPVTPPDPLNTVLALEMDRPPRSYLTGGMRIPRVAHCQYDPVAPNLLENP